MSKNGCVAIALGACLLMSSGFAWGQTPDTAGSSAQASASHLRLQLGPHTFAPLQIVPTPFVRTYLRTAIGLGQALDLNVPLLEIDTTVVLGLRGDLLFAILDFRYEHAVKDWLSVWADFRILGRLGTGIQSLLSQGISAAIGFEVGTMFRLYESKRFLLSGTTHLSNRDATLINLLDFVEGIIDSGKVTPAHPLVRTTPILTGGAGLRAASSISPLAGIYGHGLTGLTETTRAGETARWFYDVGAVLDLDLGAVGFIPVGVSTGYAQTDLTAQTQRVADEARTVLLAFSYRGRPDYSISLEMTWEWLPSALTDETIKAGSILLMTQYFF